MTFEERHPGLKGKILKADTVVETAEDLLNSSCCRVSDIAATQLDKQRVRDVLIEAYGDPREYPVKEPGHGPCCTCQDCGQSFEGCRCLERRVWKDLGLDE